MEKSHTHTHTHTHTHSKIFTKIPLIKVILNLKSFVSLDLKVLAKM
jgi:hypothetical protein